MNILVVDDEPQLRHIFRRLLTAGGYQVRVASDGPQALAMAEDGTPVELLVTDLRMPSMHGVDLAREVQQRRAVKVLFMSGQSDAADLDRALAGSDTAFIAKPFSGPELLAAVRTLTSTGDVDQAAA